MSNGTTAGPSCVSKKVLKRTYCTIHQIEIHPVDRVIYSSNNLNLTLFAIIMIILAYKVCKGDWPNFLQKCLILVLLLLTSSVLQLYYPTAQSKSTNDTQIENKHPAIMYCYLDSWLFTVKKTCLTSRLRMLCFSIHLAFPTLWEMSRKT